MRAFDFIWWFGFDLKCLVEERFDFRLSIVDLYWWRVKNFGGPGEEGEMINYELRITNYELVEG